MSQKSVPLNIANVTCILTHRFLLWSWRGSKEVYFAAQDIVLRFVPVYLKSFRQIIICHYNSMRSAALSNHANNFK